MAYIYDLTDTWNAGGTTFNAIKMNVTDSASAAGSKLVTLQTNGTEHFSVTKAGVGYFSGNVGIGTSSPSALLHVKLATDVNARFLNAYSGVALGATTDVGAETKLIFFGNPVAFVTNDTERMRIDGSGNVGIGTSSPGAKLDVAGEIRIYPSSSPAQLRFGVSGVEKGKLAVDSSSNMLFEAAGSERMRIDASGNLLVGKTTATITDQGAEIKANGQINSALPTGSDFWNAYSTSAAAYRFYVTNGGTIYATSTSITAISDQRLKENVRDLDAGLDAVLALKPRRFDWKDGKGKDVKDDIGFIAQEVESVLPELIGGWKAGEGEPDDLKSVKAGDLIPVLVKAIQELTARVAQLEGN